MRLVVCLIIAAALCHAQANGDASRLKNPLSSQPQAVELGKSRFSEACAACHGANAQGGRGPNLAQNEHVVHLNDEQFFNTIRHGIPAAGMPAFPLPDTAIWQLVTFLRSLSTPAFLVPVAGDAHAGEAVYRKSKCDSCHMIAGHGGFLGPDLTDVAASSTLKQLRDSLFSPVSNPLDGFAGVTVTLKNGEHITGVAKNYSNYSIDILDDRGSLHLLDMSDVDAVDFATKSLMPDTYAHSLSAEELQNLIAFLSRQAVRPDARLNEKPTPQEVH